MVANTKPVPWEEIRRRYVGGESENAIAQQMTAEGYKISRQAIRKRRMREGWKMSDREAKVYQFAKAWLPKVTTGCQTGSHLTTGASESTTQLANWGKRTPENMATILGWIERTGSQRLAAMSVGIDPDTLRRWKKSDRAFAGMVEKANSEFCLNRMDEISKAGKRGDWKASDRLLASHPLTREDFSQANGGGGGITVNLNFAMDRGQVAAEGEVIEVEAVKD